MDRQRQGLSPQRMWVAAKTLALAALLCCVLASGAAAAGYSVKHRVKLSGATGLPAACGEGEVASTPQIDVDPRNERRLVAVYLDHGGSAAAAARSSDGGRTWRRRLGVTDASACAGGPQSRTFLVNPYLDVGRGGTAFFGNSYVGTDTGLFRYGVLSHRLPWGRGWDRGVRLDPGAYSQDAAVVVNPVNPDLVRYVWTRFIQVPNPATYLPAADQLVTATSKDGGANFGPPQVIDGPTPGYFTDNPAVALTKDRAIAVAVRRPSAGDLVELVTGATEIDVRVDLLRSSGGTIWSTTEGIASATLAFLSDPEGRSDVQAANGLTDFSSGPGDRLAFVDATTPGENGIATLELTLSKNGGRSFSAPMPTVRIPGQPMLPAVAIGRGGAIGLLWTDFRKDRAGDDAWRADVWFAGSTDDGRTWRRTRVDGPIDLRRSAVPGLSYDGGPLGVTQDLAALGRGFGAAYTVAPPLVKRGPTTNVRFARIAPRTRSSR